MSAKNAEGMKEHRQVVKRSGTPAKHAAPSSSPKGERSSPSDNLSYLWHSVSLRYIAGVPLRFTTCLCSVVLSGLAKPWMNEMISLITSVRDKGVAEMLI